MRDRLLSIYNHLLAAYGKQHWWPGETPFEVVVGAILTQRVSWRGVEKAIAALKQADLLDVDRLSQATTEQIAVLIRPTIYYNEKAKKLRALLDLVTQRHRGELARLFSLPVPALREELLSVRGIGEETADSIILYAADKPIFVVDAYTRRILSRLGLVSDNARYADVQKLFMDNLPADVSLYNEYHALLVRHGKERCRRTNPRCTGCPLLPSCSFIAGISAVVR